MATLVLRCLQPEHGCDRRAVPGRAGPGHAVLLVPHQPASSAAAAALPGLAGPGHLPQHPRLEGQPRAQVGKKRIKKKSHFCAAELSPSGPRCNNSGRSFWDFHPPPPPPPRSSTVRCLHRSFRRSVFSSRFGGSKSEFHGARSNSSSQNVWNNSGWEPLTAGTVPREQSLGKHVANPISSAGTKPKWPHLCTPSF